MTENAPPGKERTNYYYPNSQDNIWRPREANSCLRLHSQLVTDLGLHVSLPAPLSVLHTPAQTCHALQLSGLITWPCAGVTLIRNQGCLSDLRFVSCRASCLGLRWWLGYILITFWLVFMSETPVIMSPCHLDHIFSCQMQKLSSWESAIFTEHVVLHWESLILTPIFALVFMSSDLAVSVSAASVPCPIFQKTEREKRKRKVFS